MLVHSEPHTNHITNMNEKSFLSGGCRRERRHEGKSFQVTWQAFGDKDALIHKTLRFLYLHWYLAQILKLFACSSGHMNCPSPRLPYYTVCILSAILLTFIFLKSSSSMNCSLSCWCLCAWFCCWQWRGCRCVRRKEWATAGLLLCASLCSVHAGPAGLSGWSCLWSLAGLPARAEAGTTLQDTWLAGVCQRCLSVWLEPERRSGTYISSFLIWGVAVFLPDISVTKSGGVFCRAKWRNPEWVG